MPTKEEIRQFSVLVEDIVSNSSISYMDAILLHCDTTGLEVDVAATLISPALKAKIREEAEDNNMLKKTSKLPI